MLSDSQQALQLDQNCLEAYLQQGEALVMLGKQPHCYSLQLIDEGMESLITAKSLSF